MASLFVYGSLIFPPIWQSLVTQNYPSQPAFLANYQRSKIFFDNYPLIYQDANSSGFLGLLYPNIDNQDLQRLDRFEGEIYERSACEVWTVSGPLAAEVFTPKPEYWCLVSQTPWTPDLFKRCLMPSFLQRYCSHH